MPSLIKITSAGLLKAHLFAGNSAFLGILKANFHTFILITDMSACVSVSAASQSTASLASPYQQTLQTLTTESREVAANVLHLLRIGSPLCCPQDLLEALVSEEEIRRKSREALCEEMVATGKAQIEGISVLEAHLEQLKKQFEALQILQERRVRKGCIESYDLTICAAGISAILGKGWEVHTNSLSNAVSQSRDRPLVAVVGMYNSGKTHLLSRLMNAELPPGSTPGLAFKSIAMDRTTELILIDTAGLYKPLRLLEADSGYDQEATEQLVSDVVLSLSDYFICVVGNWTSIEQRFVQKVTTSLASAPNRTFREVIVVHNLKEIADSETLRGVWSRQIADITNTAQHTQIAAVNPQSGKVESRVVSWAKSEQCRHVCLVDDYSELGCEVNPWTVGLVKAWLKGIVVAVNRDKPLISHFVSIAEQKLSLFYRQTVTVNIREISPIQAVLTGKIENTAQLQTADLLLASSVAHDKSVLSFTPAVDIFKGTSHFQVYIDLPGVTLSDISLARISTLTVVRGKKPKIEGDNYLRRERNRGEFVVSFEVPQEYEKRWSRVQLSNGILTLFYPKDTHS